MPKDCERLKKGKKLVKAIEYWANDKQTLKHIKDPYEAAFRLFERDFYVPLQYAIYDDSGGGFLTNGRINMFAKELYKLNESVASGDISLKNFWSGSALGRKDPAVGFTIKELERVTRNDRKRSVESTNKYREILDSLKVAAGIDGVFDKNKLRRAQNEYRKLDLELIKAIDRGDNKAATEVRERIKNFVKRSPLKVFDDFINVIEEKMPIAIKAKYDEELRLSKDESLNKKKRRRYASNIKGYDEGTKLVRLDDNDYYKYLSDEVDPVYFDALIKYNNLMSRMYGVLEEGINQRIRTIIDKVRRNKGAQTKNEKDLEELRKNLISDIMPKYKEDGFFPHYVRDLNATYMEGLMPYFEKLDIASNDFINKKDKSIDDIIGGINTWISNHQKGRSQKEKFGYSRNFLDVVKGYVDDVNRFNTSAFMDDALVKSLEKAEDLYKGGESSNYSKNVTDLILDLHQAANGDTEMGEGRRAVTRTLLSFEFISKIGLNPRSAVRNSTQRLLDYVQFGRRISKLSHNELYNMSLFGDTKQDVESQIDNILKDAGLLFEDTTPELLESTIKQSPSLYKLRTINEDGTITYNKESNISKFADVTSRVAQMASWMHRGIENSNRKHTFKIAFGQMHNLLRTSSAFRKKLIDQGKTAEQIKSEIIRISKNYGNNMVISNHFDYADYAKAKFMRKGIGRFMFQFQHYSMEFLEKNIHIAREASSDMSSFVKDKDFTFKDAEGMHKATRMAIAYYLAPLAAMTLMPINLENLIEHDTLERIKQWATLFTNDPEEVNKAFYGKGAIISTFGGPLLGDMIDIGVSYDLINMDTDGITDMLIGIDTYTNDTNISDTGRKIKILNVFLGRAYDRHFPMAASGHAGMAIQQELGLYPRPDEYNVWQTLTPELFEKKKSKKKKLKGAHKLPYGVYQSLRAMEREAALKSR
tara:strand:- start:2866 stop:5658 length:2793 start_codon:yes stop_codon:yes gene_type:complete